MNRRSLVLATLALPLLTGLTYLPALRGGFIWDDDDHFSSNPAMTESGGLRKIWSSLRVSRYYPLTLTTFWVQRRLWGLNPLPYHATNIVLHGVSAALLFVLLRRLNVPGAWAAAALWTVHPVNVESVAWVTELKNVQSGLFFFLALLCYLHFEKIPKPIWYALSLLCFAAALLSKPSTVVFPLVVLLTAWWQRGPWKLQDLWRTVPFFLMSAAMSLLTIAEQRGQIERGPQEWSLSLAERLAVAGQAVWFYAGKTFWPSQLTFVYPRWHIDAESLIAPLPWMGSLIVLACLWRLRKHAWARAALFGLGFFLIALLPVLGFFDIYFFRYSFVADHFQYLACLGLIALVSAGGAILLQKRAAQYSAAGVAVIVLAAMSWRHCHTFRDHETLWRDTLAKNPRAAIAYVNLGALLNSEKQYEAAIGCFQQAIRLKPGTVEPHNNMGIALTELGRYDEALFEFQEALRCDPDYPPAHYRLGVLYAKMNRLDEAEQQLLKTITYGPPMPEAFFDLGVIWERQGKRDRAPKAYRDALRIKPDYAFAHNNLANLLAEDGKLEEAIDHYRQAVVADPKLETAHHNLAILLLRTGDTNSAIEHLRVAVQLQPERADTRLELGQALIGVKRYAEAVETFQSGLEVEPQNAALENAFAWLLATCPDAQWRDGKKAVQIGERVAELTNRKLPQVLDTLAAAYAEDGRFEVATDTAREAMVIARSNNDTNLVTQLSARVTRYERRQPYRLDDTK
jgi:tetratricopeptide (TPR) repeat protein